MQAVGSSVELRMSSLFFPDKIFEDVQCQLAIDPSDMSKAHLAMRASQCATTLDWRADLLRLGGWRELEQSGLLRLEIDGALLQASALPITATAPLRGLRKSILLLCLLLGRETVRPRTEHGGDDFDAAGMLHRHDAATPVSVDHIDPVLVSPGLGAL